MSGSRQGQVLVCFAVKQEAAPFRRALPSNVTLLVTGMGAVAAERVVTERLSEGDWSAVLTCGFAGGLNPDLPIGVVLVDSDEDFPLRQVLLDAGAQPGSFHCAEHVAVTAFEKTMLRERTGADAIEMESGIIRQLCRTRSIPSATVRVISDTAQEDLPLDFNTLVKADGKLSLGKLAGQVLRRPRKIPALIALGRHSKLAARRLAAVLRSVLAR